MAPCQQWRVMCKQTQSSLFSWFWARTLLLNISMSWDWAWFLSVTSSTQAGSSSWRTPARRRRSWWSPSQLTAQKLRKKSRNQSPPSPSSTSTSRKRPHRKGTITENIPESCCILKGFGELNQHPFFFFLFTFIHHFLLEGLLKVST